MLFPSRLPMPDECLHRVARQARALAAQAYEDVRVNGDNPVTKHSEWQLFHRFPVVTRATTSVWRIMAARSFDDLAEDFRSGAPYPRTIGEQVALCLAVSDCRTVVDRRHLATLRGLLIDDGLVEALHDPTSSQARTLRDDPDVWFRSLIPGLERDPGRGFRGWQ